jgi:hypothetical protein
MQTIEAKVQINADRTLTVQLPGDVQIGEYDVVLVLNSRSAHTEQQKSGEPEGKQAETMTRAWEQWVEEVEQLPLSPNPTRSDFQQDLIEKYRKQGLEL